MFDFFRYECIFTTTCSLLTRLVFEGQITTKDIYKNFFREPTHLAAIPADMTGYFSTLLTTILLLSCVREHMGPEFLSRVSTLMLCLSHMNYHVSP